MVIELILLELELLEIKVSKDFSEKLRTVILLFKFCLTDLQAPIVN